MLHEGKPPPGNLADHIDEPEQRGPRPRSDVDRPAIGCLTRARSGEDVRLDHVVDVREVPGLLTVAIEIGDASVERGLEEVGNDRGIGGVRTLAWPEDVEVPQRDTLNESGPGEGEHVLFAGQLRRGIW